MNQIKLDPLGGGLWSLTIIQDVKVWVFPSDRFIEYGPEDEWWARRLSFGHEEIRERTIHVPRAIVNRVDKNEISFTALPESIPVGIGDGTNLRESRE